MPKLTIFNPTKGRRFQIAGANVLSTRAYSLEYWHADPDAEDRGTRRYVHKFAAGVTIELLPDGSVRLYRPDRKPLFKRF